MKTFFFALILKKMLFSLLGYFKVRIKICNYIQVI